MRADGSALTFRYFTQPLPTPLAWFAHQLPSWWQWLSLKVMFFIELVLPFFLFAPRRPRLFAAGGVVLLQVLIALTGNYGFFNILTAALCLLAVDDTVWRASHRIRSRSIFMPCAFLWPVAAALFCSVSCRCFRPSGGPCHYRSCWFRLYEAVAPFRTVNGYGLFAVATPGRREIIIQGSEDGLVWKTYSFRFKPGDPRRSPPWVAPYMPRLDWQMWFAALGEAGQNPRLFNLMKRLLEGSPAVLGLLE